MTKSKTHKWLIVMFITATSFVIFGFMDGTQWIAMMFGQLFTGLGRDIAKDKDSILNKHMEAKREAISKKSDSALASDSSKL